MAAAVHVVPGARAFKDFQNALLDRARANLKSDPVAAGAWVAIANSCHLSADWQQVRRMVNDGAPFVDVAQLCIDAEERWWREYRSAHGVPVYQWEEA